MDEKHGSKGRTGTYHVRGVSRDLHRTARRRAVSQGTTLRRVMLQALEAYGAGTWAPAGESPRSGADGI